MTLQCGFCNLILSSDTVHLLGESPDVRLAVEYSNLMLKTSEHLARDHQAVWLEEIMPTMTIAGQVAVMRLMRISDGALTQMFEVYSERLVRLGAGDSIATLISAGAESAGIV